MCERLFHRWQPANQMQVSVNGALCTQYPAQVIGTVCNATHGGAAAPAITEHIVWHLLTLPTCPWLPQYTSEHPYTQPCHTRHSFMITLSWSHLMAPGTVASMRSSKLPNPVTATISCSSAGVVLLWRGTKLHKAHDKVTHHQIGDNEQPTMLTTVATQQLVVACGCMLGMGQLLHKVAQLLSCGLHCSSCG